MAGRSCGRATWDPVFREFGALPFIAGTLITSLLALVLAVPVSLGIAIFLSELAPDWLRTPLGFLVELLAAVPSVVYGLWGLYVLIPSVVQPVARLLNGALGFLPFFEGPVYGPSRLAASVVLAIMITPTISAVSRDVFRAIPRGQREASLALGATQWETIWQVLLPYGMSGVLGAVILGLGRALGETMAVTMVIGNNLDLSASLLHPGLHHVVHHRQRVHRGHLRPVPQRPHRDRPGAVRADPRAEPLRAPAGVERGPPRAEGGADMTVAARAADHAPQPGPAGRPTR